MRQKLLALSITLTLSTPVIVHAKTNTEAGKQQAAACAGCHGETGNSAVPTFPKLAGQHAPYLIKTLQELKKGTRKAPMMAPLAASLSDESMAELAAFYAAQPISTNEMPVLPLSDEEEDEEEEAAIALIKQQQQEKLTALLAQGKSLYFNGNLESNVSACSACHGTKGDGNLPASYPVLKGQHADYLIKTLTDFQKDHRTQESDNIMGMIAKKMTEKEIQAVSYYISVMNHQK
jgi:cytochrome c553